VQEVPPARGLQGYRRLFRISGEPMNWDRIAGNWKQLKGSLKERWGKVTDDELDQLAGQRDRLVGKIQERYGVAKVDAEKQVREWESRQQ
jgi:uncharacterized protein YjbJ (UPF0337 family)